MRNRKFVVFFIIMAFFALTLLPSFAKNAQAAYYRNCGYPSDTGSGQGPVCDLGWPSWCDLWGNGSFITSMNGGDPCYYYGLVYENTYYRVYSGAPVLSCSWV